MGPSVGGPSDQLDRDSLVSIHATFTTRPAFADTFSLYMSIGSYGVWDDV